MKYLLKGTVVTTVILIVLMAINVFCNMNGIHLDVVVTGTISAVCAMLFFDGLTKKEKNECRSNEGYFEN